MQQLVMQTTSKEHAALAAEYLVCVDFLRRGYSATQGLWPHCPFDVLVDCGDQTYLRVQVKSTSGVTVKSRHKGRVYCWSLDKNGLYAKNGGVDLFAFVALDQMKIWYVPPADLLMAPGKFPLNKHVGHTVFAQKAEGSLDRFLLERFCG